MFFSVTDKNLASGVQAIGLDDVFASHPSSIDRM
jgi:hypothetical protein